MSIKEEASTQKEETSQKTNNQIQVLKEYEELFKITDEYPKDLHIRRKDLEILQPNCYFLRKIKFTMMDRILIQRRKNTREQNMKKIYSIIKQYLKDKRGIKNFYKFYFKNVKIKFNQKNLMEMLQSEPVKEEVIRFLEDEIAFKNYALQYIEYQTKNFIQNYKINFQKYLFANKKQEFMEYLKNSKKAKYPWTYQMVDKARKQFLEFFFREYQDQPLAIQLYQIFTIILNELNYINFYNSQRKKIKQSTNFSNLLKFQFNQKINIYKRLFLESQQEII